MTDYRFTFDERLFRAINGLGWDWLDAVWVAASARTFGVGVAVLLGVWVLVQLRRKAVRPLLQISLATLITDQLGNQVLKPFFGRIRPCFALPASEVHKLVDISAVSGSMPSLHAANGFTYAVALTLCVPRSAWFTVPVAVIVGVSRIGVGVHWPSDVLAGMVFGSLVGLLVHLVLQRVTARMGAAQVAQPE